jgi:hypothetical protein
MTEFIFMLTRDDLTVGNALKAYSEVRDSGLRYVGFKDVGMPVERLRDLAEAIRDDGREVMLEVVSEDADEELRSVEAAVGIGVDWVLGGTHPEAALPVLAGTGIRYCPFPGRVIGHPSLLRGTIGEIADSADQLTSTRGVHGLDLLAYRFDGDVEALVAEVVGRSHGPVIAAGSVDTLDRVATLARLGVWGFTIGSAVFNGQLPGAPSLRGQIDRVLEAIESVATAPG